ncbi:MAG: hypothetical protein ACO3P1_05285 [Pseudomonadales bacterium]
MTQIHVGSRAYCPGLRFIETRQRAQQRRLAAAIGSDQLEPSARSQLEGELGDDGRILIRPSGTEPLVRVMVEAALQADAERIATTLAEAIERSYEPMNDDDGDE